MRPLSRLMNPSEGRQEKSIDVGNLVKATERQHLLIVPSNYNMMLAEQALNPVKGREYRLDLLIEAAWKRLH